MVLNLIAIGVAVLIGVSMFIRLNGGRWKVGNPLLNRWLKRIGTIGQVANGVIFIGSFMWILVMVIILMAHSK